MKSNSLPHVSTLLTYNIAWPLVTWYYPFIINYHPKCGALSNSDNKINKMFSMSKTALFEAKLTRANDLLPHLEIWGKNITTYIVSIWTLDFSKFSGHFTMVELSKNVH